MRPTCEACSVFQCSCIYGKQCLGEFTGAPSKILSDTAGADAIPKKRGPKTDVLEALLKRVDGLEKRLQDEKRASKDDADDAESIKVETREVEEQPQTQSQAKRLSIESTPSVPNSAALFSPIEHRYEVLDLSYTVVSDADDVSCQP